MRNTNNLNDREIQQEIESLCDIAKKYSGIPMSTYIEHYEWEMGSHIWKRLPYIFDDMEIVHETGCVCAFHGIPVRFNNNNPDCLKLWRRV